jgi:hypothetical protein
MTHVRKTVDCWRFYISYGQGWEYENIEFTRGAMLENKRAYLENCAYPLQIVKGRMNKSELSPGQLEEIEATKKLEMEQWRARRAKKSPNASVIQASV